MMGEVVQMMTTTNHVTGEVKETSMIPEEGIKRQLVCEIPLMLFDPEKQKLSQHPLKPYGVIIHKGSPVTLLPYQTFVDNKMICIMRKISSHKCPVCDIWSRDYENPFVYQRFSINYRKQHRKPA